MADGPSQFVVQEHRTPDGVHWDLMLQIDQRLWTWRMARHPADVGNTPLPLEKIADHPLRFLTYEGPVQNKTGSVQIADRGRAEMLAQTPNALTVCLDGLHLKGQFILSKTDSGPLWTLSRP